MKIDRRGDSKSTTFPFSPFVLTGDENSSSTETSVINVELECARLLRAFQNGYRSDIPLECEPFIRDNLSKKQLSNLDIHNNRIPPAMPRRKEHYENEEKHRRSLPEIPPRGSFSASEDDVEIRDRFLRRVTSTISNFGGVLRKTSSEDSQVSNASPTMSVSSLSPSTSYYIEESNEIGNSEKNLSKYNQRRTSCSNKNKSDHHPSYCESYQHYLMTGYHWE